MGWLPMARPREAARLRGHLMPKVRGEIIPQEYQTHAPHLEPCRWHPQVDPHSHCSRCGEPVWEGDSHECPAGFLTPVLTSLGTPPPGPPPLNTKAIRARLEDREYPHHCPYCCLVAPKLLAEIERLRGLLIKYGRHLNAHGLLPDSDQLCTCGLSRELAGLVRD
jgi:hypothetical protein